MESEYEKVKNDPLKLQLFNVKKKEYLEKLRYTKEFASVVMDKMNELEKPKSVCTPKSICIPQPIKVTKINNINPTGTTISKVFKIPVSDSRGNSMCRTKFIKFKIPGPTSWMYDYKLERLTTNNLSDFVIDITSVPSDHIIIKDSTVSIKLYFLDRVWKEAIILFTPNKKTEEGSVIRTHIIA